MYNVHCFSVNYYLKIINSGHGLDHWNNFHSKLADPANFLPPQNQIIVDNQKLAENKNKIKNKKHSSHWDFQALKMMHMASKGFC
jgi:hypothetical protein